MSYAFLHTFNNVFPPEGSKVIPLQLTFAGAETRNLNLLQAIQTRRITLIQGLYFNNVDGEDSELICVNSAQKVTIPKGTQGSFNLLNSTDPEFSISASGAGVLIAHLTNFPVPNYIWRNP